MSSNDQSKWMNNYADPESSLVYLCSTEYEKADNNIWLFVAFCPGDFQRLIKDHTDILQKRNVWGAVPLLTFVLEVGNMLFRRPDWLSEESARKLFLSTPESLAHLGFGKSLVHARDFIGNGLIHYSIRLLSYSPEDDTSTACSPLNDGSYILQVLKKGGCDVNERNECGLTPLAHSVLNENDIWVADILMDNGANPTIADDLGRNCFHLSAFSKSVDSFQRMLERCETSHPGTVNDQDLFGRTPFHYICIFQTLIKCLYDSCHEDDVVEKSADLTIAALFENIDSIEEDVDLNEKLENAAAIDYLVLDEAGQKQQKRKSLLRNMSVQDSMGRTPLHYAAFHTTRCDDYDDLFDSDVARKVLDCNGHSATAIRSSIRSTIQPLHLRAVCDDLRAAIPSFYTAGVGLNFEGLMNYMNDFRSGWKTWVSNAVDSLHRDCLRVKATTAFVTKRVIEFVSALVETISSDDSRFKCHLEFIGSQREGTRVGWPDEFDFNIVLENISKQCTVTTENCTRPFILFKKRDGENPCEKEYESFFNEHAFLVTSRIKAAFAMCVNRALFSKAFWNKGNLQDIFLINPEILDIIRNGDSILSHKLVYTLQILITHPVDDGSYFNHIIHIDLAPTLLLPEPPYLIERPSAVPGGLQECFALFYPPQQFYSYTDVGARIAFHVDSNNSYAYVTFSKSESEMVRTAPSAAKDAFVLAKSLFTSDDSDEGRCFDTYTLKTSLMFCLFESSNGEQQQQQIEDHHLAVSDWLKRIIGNMYYFSVSCPELLPLFFAPIEVIQGISGLGGKFSI